MTGSERREKIIQFLLESKEPITGSALAARLSVSRQIIVQDIALLRAANTQIIATPKGYFILSF